MTQLLTNERILITTRQHWSVVTPTIVLYAIVSIVLLVAIHLVPGTIDKKSVESIKHGADAVVVVVFVLASLERYLRWRAAVYTLTNHRIIEVRGVVSRLTESITLDRIQDVVVRQGLGDRMIGRGNVEIESAARDGVEVLAKVPHPQVFYSTLMEAMQAINNPQLAAPAQLPMAPPPPAMPPGGV